MKNTIKTLAATLVLAAVLVACSATASNPEAAGTPTVPATTDTPTPVVQTPAPVAVTPAPTATVAPVALAVGATLTAEQAAALPAGQRGYPMADGTLVLVSKSEPVPEVVKADAAAPAIAAIAARGASALGSSTPLTDAANGAVAKIMGETGRNAVAIYKLYSAGQGWRWQATGAARSNPIAVSPAAILAHVEAWIATQPDPGSWEIINAG